MTVTREANEENTTERGDREEASAHLLSQGPGSQIGPGASGAGADGTRGESQGLAVALPLLLCDPGSVLPPLQDVAGPASQALYSSGQ